MAIGNHKLLEPNWGGTLLTVPRDYFGPDAMDRGCRGVAKFSHFRKTTRTTDGYAPKCDLLRRRAEGCMQPGATFPDASVAVLC